MNCPLCGETCRCQPDAPSAQTIAAGQDKQDPQSPHAAPSSGPDETANEQSAAAGDSSNAVVGESAVSGDAAWRSELSARLSRYRARRRLRPPRYPSLSLPFDPEKTQRSLEASITPSPFEPVSEHALALDAWGHAADVPQNRLPASDDQLPAPNPPVDAVGEPRGRAGAKIIEFPRFAWSPPPPPSDQLAEPVIDRPRILEVPEVAPPPPALGGITIEPAQRPELERRPGIDFPLQGASLTRRVFAGLVDGLIVVAASVLFGTIFWRIAAVRPPIPQILALAAGVPIVFWFAYQYLLIVYSGGTPGMRAARLELRQFNSNPARRSLRRWRVLASYLSAASLGMGYGWVFLDEDSLCWHDRITHTYLHSRPRAEKVADKTA